jgi:hypothetical protein
MAQSTIAGLGKDRGCLPDTAIPWFKVACLVLNFTPKTYIYFDLPPTSRKSLFIFLGVWGGEKWVTLSSLSSSVCLLSYFIEVGHCGFSS